jgi:hypothetical protein
MDRSNLIMGALMFAFLVFITTRGELRAYLKVMGL